MPDQISDITCKWVRPLEMSKLVSEFAAHTIQQESKCGPEGRKRFGNKKKQRKVTDHKKTTENLKKS